MKSRLDKNALAQKLWDIANKLRGNIDASEYKNFILPILFYKYLSEKQIAHITSDFGINGSDIYLLEQLDDANVKLKENLFEKYGIDESEVENIKDNALKTNGYYIEYKYLFHSLANSFSDEPLIISFRNALSNIIKVSNEGVEDGQTSIISGPFSNLNNDITKLGSEEHVRSEKLRELLACINSIPTSSEDVDVLGFIYMYLIEQFAVNAGKKGGEFYTPHEVSKLMAEIVGDHVSKNKNQKKLTVYDPASGSGSLLITIGEIVKKHNPSIKHDITYYAQEINQTTFNLGKMNLLMHGINMRDLRLRNNDTLAQDWPISDEDKEKTELNVDVVVANPPYSIEWDNNESDRVNDERFIGYGIAPKKKADFAFLLHGINFNSFSNAFFY